MSWSPVRDMNEFKSHVNCDPGAAFLARARERHLRINLKSTVKALKLPKSRAEFELTFQPRIKRIFNIY